MTPPGGGRLTGAVVFRDGAIPIGASTLGPDGRARLTFLSLAPGPHRFTVAYAGDGNYQASVSAPLALAVPPPAAPPPPARPPTPPAVQRLAFALTSFTLAR